MFLVLYLKYNHQTPNHVNVILFSSRSFIVFLFILTSTNNFEFILVKAIRSVSRLIFLCMETQLLQHHVLKDYSISIDLPLYLCQKSFNCLCVVYLWTLYPVPLIFVSILLPIQHCLNSSIHCFIHAFIHPSIYYFPFFKFNF